MRSHVDMRPGRGAVLRIVGAVLAPPFSDVTGPNQGHGKQCPYMTHIGP